MEIDAFSSLLFDDKISRRCPLDPEARHVCIRKIVDADFLIRKSMTELHLKIQ